ncbi:hypothetical protein [Burkholderia ubonensis]|uniref:Uncharacterized protein n=1 Tax=Burkholderia ubonensis subsp. mesacidophila TaxID=265293 RepID=A0A2A4FHV5_9BURK|nr:hypothetical protein [Burkholderia ubonensis]PCE32961.1 hypothetical protein BZL54_07470 [Burkholderia ubonensis subsp. mesacidophila]
MLIDAIRNFCARLKREIAAAATPPQSDAPPAAPKPRPAGKKKLTRHQKAKADLARRQMAKGVVVPPRRDHAREGFDLMRAQIDMKHARRENHDLDWVGDIVDAVVDKPASGASSAIRSNRPD